MVEELQYLSKRYILLKYTVIGTAIGYFILHPLILFITTWMDYHVEEGYFHLHSLSGSIPTLWWAFSKTMLPRGVAFIILGAGVGFYYGILMYRSEVYMKRIDGFDEYLKSERHLRGGVIRQRTTQLFQLKESNERFQNRIAKYKQKTNDLEKEIKKLKKRS